MLTDAALKKPQPKATHYKVDGSGRYVRHRFACQHRHLSV